jgi:hypothetical protein
VAVSAAPASTRSASSSSTYLFSEGADVPVVESGASVVTVFTVEKPRATHGPGTGRDHERRVVQTRTHIRRRLERFEADAELLAEHEPELYQELQAAVRAEASTDTDTE